MTKTPGNSPIKSTPDMAVSAASDEARQFTVEPDDDDIRLDRWFQRHVPDMSFNMVSRWARTGQIRLDGKRTAPNERLTKGQIIRMPPAIAGARDSGPRVAKELSAEQIAHAHAMVIHKDRAALVVNKPPGLATQGGTKTHSHVDGLGDALMFDSPVRPRLVHRLDKDTSGVLLMARTPGSAAYFAKRFAGRTAKKIYWALVVGVPDIYAGIIDLPLGKQPGSGGEKMHVDEENGQMARTAYQVVERAGNRAAWVALQPYTGRTHQLRVHMAAIGHPIVGDGKYGGPDAFLTGSISRKMHLHARRLKIPHPDGPALDVTADLPPHFAESMEQMGFDITLADNAFEDDTPPPTREDKKQKARAHAKQLRKSKRGERRARGGEPEMRPTKPKPAKAAPTGPRRGPGKTAARKSAGSIDPRTGGGPAKGAAPTRPSSGRGAPSGPGSPSRSAAPSRRGPAPRRGKT